MRDALHSSGGRHLSDEDEAEPLRQRRRARALQYGIDRQRVIDTVLHGYPFFDLQTIIWKADGAVVSMFVDDREAGDARVKGMAPHPMSTLRASESARRFD